MATWKKAPVIVAIALSAVGLALVVLLVTTVRRLDVVDPIRGVLGVAASCDTLKPADLKRDYPRQSRGLGLGFKPYAEGLKACGTLIGEDRKSVRAIFGPDFDSDSRVDAWRIGSDIGLMGPEQDRSMAIHYSAEGLVVRITTSP